MLLLPRMSVLRALVEVRVLIVVCGDITLVLDDCGLNFCLVGMVSKHK